MAGLSQEVEGRRAEGLGVVRRGLESSGFGGPGSWVLGLASDSPWAQRLGSWELGGSELEIRTVLSGSYGSSQMEFPRVSHLGPQESHFTVCGSL